MTSINAKINRKGRNHKLTERYARGTDLHKHFGSFEKEVLENEDQSTKHSNLENEAPIENEALEKEALKTRNHSRLNNYNFTSSMTKSESSRGSGCVRTSKGRQNPSQGFIKACKLFNWTFLDRISCINFIISLAMFDTSYFNMHFFFWYTYMFMWTSKLTVFWRMQVCVSNNTKGLKRVWKRRVRLARKTLTLSCLIPAVLARDCTCLVFIKDGRVSSLRVVVFEFLGSSFSRFGCFVFEI